MWQIEIPQQDCWYLFTAKRHGETKRVVENNNTSVQEPPKPSDTFRICVGCMIPRSQVCHILWSHRPRQWLWFARILAKPRMDTPDTPVSQDSWVSLQGGKIRTLRFQVCIQWLTINIMLNFLPNSKCREADSEMWASVLSAPSGKNYAMEPHSLDVGLQNGMISS